MITMQQPSLNFKEEDYKYSSKKKFLQLSTNSIFSSVGRFARVVKTTVMRFQRILIRRQFVA